MRGFGAHVILVDQGVGHLQVGLGSRQRLLGVLVVGLAGGVAFVHVFLPRIFGLRLDQGGLFCHLLRPRRSQCGLCILEVVLLRGVVDIGDLLPHFDNVAHLDIQLLDLTRSLRPHIDQP